MAMIICDAGIGDVIDAGAKQRQVVVLVAGAAERLDGPQRLPARQAERAERVGVGQPLDDARRQAGAQPQIADRGVGRRDGHDQLRVVLAQSLDLAQAEPQRMRRADVVRHFAMEVVQVRGRARALLQRRVPLRVIDVDRPHLDAVLAHVAHDLRRRIEAHRLRVEQRRREHVRIAALEPGRRVDQQREARGVAFGKTVFAEALDLLEAALGEIARVAVRRPCLR